MKKTNGEIKNHYLHGLQSWKLGRRGRVPTKLEPKILKSYNDLHINTDEDLSKPIFTNIPRTTPWTLTTLIALHSTGMTSLKLPQTTLAIASLWQPLHRNHLIADTPQQFSNDNAVKAPSSGRANQLGLFKHLKLPH